MATSAGSRLLETLEHAAALRHSGRSFLEHLYGTWRILADWRSPVAACRAGLFHSAYSTASYPHALFPLQRRKALRAMIGRESEELVFRFCTMERRGYWDALGRRRSARPLTYRLRTRPEAAVRVSRRTLVQLLLIESANLAEQTCAPDGGPAPWMSRVSAWWRFLHERDLPRGLGARPSLSLRQDEAAIAAYRNALSSSERRAVAWLDRAIELNPWAGEPRVLRALHAGLDHRSNAELDIAAGVKLLSAWGVAWDKRLSLEAWKTLASQAAGDARGRVRHSLTFDATRQVLSWACAGAPLARDAVPARRISTSEIRAHVER
jgi:hypothetical protein